MEIPLSPLTPPAVVTADDPPHSEPTAGTGHRILLSTTSSDSHTWNLVFLQLLLEECGHEVLNLGPCVPDALLVETARSHRPSAIVISTVNGHGRIDGARLARAVRRDPEIAQVPMMIGGKLGIAGTSSDDEVSRLLEAGFDAVFIGDTSPDELPTTLTRMLPAARPELSEACRVR
jgi:methylmalonyl-CoA mutase cobalamin-binding subunit